MHTHTQDPVVYGGCIANINVKSLFSPRRTPFRIPPLAVKASMIRCPSYICGDAVRCRSRTRQVGRLCRASQRRKGRLDIATQDVRLLQVPVQERCVLRTDEISAQTDHVQYHRFLRTHTVAHSCARERCMAPVCCCVVSQKGLREYLSQQGGGGRWVLFRGPWPVFFFFFLRRTLLLCSVAL